MKAKSTLSMEGTLNAKTHAGRLINFELNLQFKFSPSPPKWLCEKKVLNLSETDGTVKDKT